MRFLPLLLLLAACTPTAGAPETGGDGPDSGEVADSGGNDSGDTADTELPAELEAGSWSTTTNNPTTSECDWIGWDEWPLGFTTEPLDAATFALRFQLYNGVTIDTECDYVAPDAVCTTGRYTDPGDGSYVITTDQMFTGRFLNADTLEGSTTVTVACESGELCEGMESPCAGVYDATWIRD